MIIVSGKVDGAQELYTTDILAGYSSSTIAWIGSIQLALVLRRVHRSLARTAAHVKHSGGLISGRLFDKGLLKHTVVIGSTLYVFWCVLALHTSLFQVFRVKYVLAHSIFMTSLSRTYWQLLLAQGIGQGLGMGLLCVFIR